jgi:hypothetical protein
MEERCENLYGLCLLIYGSKPVRPEFAVILASSHHLNNLSLTQTQTMNAVGSHMPTMLSQYHGLNAGPQVLPTPPVATRKRKRAHQYTVSYSEVQEVDSDGRLREVIVIEDTPPPPTTLSPSITNHAFSASYQPPLYAAPIRTRARAAAEAQALSASSSSAIVAPPAKKRKREPADEVRAPAAKSTAVSSQQSHAVAQTKSWDSRSAAATDEVGYGSFFTFDTVYLLTFFFFRHPKAPCHAMTRRVTT